MHMDDNDFTELRAAFATALRKQRHAKGLSQEQLGFETGLSTVFISFLETGKRQPTLTTMALLARALDVNLVDLLNELDA